MIDETAIEELVAAARRAREHAYAPYSGFAVGAAVASEAGVHIGANVENAAYPAGICAERAAASAAVSAGARSIDAVAVTASAGEPGPPCGLCRQFLSEFGSGMLVVSEGSNGALRRWRLADLLPDAFGPSNLEEAR